MKITFELRTLHASLILDVRDRFAYECGVYGNHPLPLSAVKFTIPAQIVNNTRQNLTAPLELVTKRSPSGYYLFFDRYRVSADYQARGLLLPGRYVLRVESAFYQSAEQTVDLPHSDQPYLFDLVPGLAYPFPSWTKLLWGTLRRFDGSVLARADVDLPELSRHTQTSARGGWGFIFTRKPAADITVRFTLPGGAVHSVPNFPIKLTGSELVQASLRGRAETVNGVGIAAAGIEILALPGTVHTGDDGNWRYFFDVDFNVDQQDRTVSVRATLPDGRQMTQDDIKVRPHRAGVVPPFRFD